MDQPPQSSTSVGPLAALAIELSDGWLLRHLTYKMKERHVISPLTRSVPNLGRRGALHKGRRCVLSICPSIRTRDDLLQNVAGWHPGGVIATGGQESAEHGNTHHTRHSPHGRQDLGHVAGSSFEAVNN